MLESAAAAESLDFGDDVVETSSFARTTIGANRRLKPTMSRIDALREDLGGAHPEHAGGSGGDSSTLAVAHRR